MLVLDEALSASLLAVAASEKLVTHAIDSNALYLDPTTSGFLSKGAGEQPRRQVLWDLLLHYPAVLSPFDNLDVSGLQKLGLVEGQLDSNSKDYAYSQMNNSPEAIRGVQEFVLAELCETDPAFVAKGSVDKFMQLHSSYGHQVVGRLDSAMFDMFDSFEEYVAGTKTMFDGEILQVPGRGGGPVPGSELGARIAAAANREDFEAFKAYQPFKQFMHNFAMSAQRWLALTHCSRIQGAVLSAKIPNSLLNPDLVSQPGGFREQIRIGAGQGSTHAAVQIWLDEVQCVPRLRTIEDVLRLREDKRIDSFREAMLEWTHALCSGSPAEEARLRRLVGTANSELRKLPGIERMKRYWSFATVSLDFLLAVYPPTSLPIPVTSLIGLGLMAATKEKVRPLNWVMFGSA